MHTRVMRSTLRIEQLGPSPQAAVRVLIHAFRDRGWNDRGTAAAIVGQLLSEDAGIATLRLAKAVDGAFLRENAVSRSEVQRVLERLAQGPPRSAPH